jgi:superoxide dismutase, Fe-Mn family
MTTALAQTYTAKKWGLAGLKGISDHTLQVHFGLYEGYVKNTNLLNEQIGECIRSGQGQATDPRFAEFTRRLSFEYNGMVLHEQYFDNLTSRETAAPATGSLHDAVAESFGDFDTWKKNFAAVWAGRLPIRIPIPAAFPTNGSRYTKTGTSRASGRCS